MTEPKNDGKPTLARRDDLSSPGTATRANILASARELFEEVGFARTTVEQIRRRAGVSRASFYFYFADKKSLFLEVLGELSSDIEWLRLTFAEDLADPYVRIVTELTGFFEIWSRYTTTLSDGFALTTSDPDGQQVIRGMRLHRYEQLGGRTINGVAELESFPEEQRHLVPMLMLALSTNFVSRFFAQPDVFNRSNTAFEDAVLAVAEAWYRIAFGTSSPRSVSREQINRHRSRVREILEAREAQRAAILLQRDRSRGSTTP